MSMKKRPLFTALILLGFLWNFTLALYIDSLGQINKVGKHNETMQQFIERLFKNYNHNISPYLVTGKRLNVTIALYLMTISSINVIEMDYSITMFLRQNWIDDRLRFDDEYNQTLLINSMRSRLWTPDLYFVNEKAGNFHTVSTPNLFIRLKPDGEIYFSQKITVKLACPMKLQKFPMDVQTCEMKLESYGFSIEQMIFEWQNNSSIEVAEDLMLPEFEVQSIKNLSNMLTYNTGSYPCLEVRFIFKRKFGYYLTQTYVPSMLIVILSWVSFWIDVNSVPARISLGLLTVLSVTTQSSGVKSQLPRVSYIKAIDMWMSTCLIFVFGALIEYAFANVLARKASDNLIKAKNRANLIIRTSSNIDKIKEEYIRQKRPEQKRLLPRLFPCFNDSSDAYQYTRRRKENVPLCWCTQMSCPSSWEDRVSPDRRRDQIEKFRLNALYNEIADHQESSVTPLLRHSGDSKTFQERELSPDIKDSTVDRKRKKMEDKIKIAVSRHISAYDELVEVIFKQIQSENYLPSAKIVDEMSRIGFPMAFIMFNVLYWTTYLVIIE